MEGEDIDIKVPKVYYIRVKIFSEAEMKGHNMFVRIVAILLCALMVLGVVTVAFYSFIG